MWGLTQNTAGFHTIDDHYHHAKSYCFIGRCKSIQNDAVSRLSKIEVNNYLEKGRSKVMGCGGEGFGVGNYPSFNNKGLSLRKKESSF